MSSVTASGGLQSAKLVLKVEPTFAPEQLRNVTPTLRTYETGRWGSDARGRGVVKMIQIPRRSLSPLSVW